MWEAIGNIITSGNGIAVLVLLLVVILLGVLLVKTGVLSVHTKAVSLGSSEKERRVLQEQIKFAHGYCQSIESKIVVMLDGRMPYHGFLCGKILENCYDEIIEWITFNHIENSGKYVKVKQKNMCNVLYTQLALINDPDMFETIAQFKTAEFKQRVYNWVEEIIQNLVEIRELYR